MRDLKTGIKKHRFDEEWNGKEDFQKRRVISPTGVPHTLLSESKNYLKKATYLEKKLAAHFSGWRDRRRQKLTTE